MRRIVSCVEEKGCTFYGRVGMGFNFARAEKGYVADSDSRRLSEEYDCCLLKLTHTAIDLLRAQNGCGVIL